MDYVYVPPYRRGSGYNSGSTSPPAPFGAFGVDGAPRVVNKRPARQSGPKSQTRKTVVTREEDQVKARYTAARERKPADGIETVHRKGQGRGDYYVRGRGKSKYHKEYNEDERYDEYDEYDEHNNGYDYQKHDTYDKNEKSKKYEQYKQYNSKYDTYDKAENYSAAAVTSKNNQNDEEYMSSDESKPKEYIQYSKTRKKLKYIAKPKVNGAEQKTGKDKTTKSLKERFEAARAKSRYANDEYEPNGEYNSKENVKDKGDNENEEEVSHGTSGMLRGVKVSKTSRHSRGKFDEKNQHKSSYNSHQSHPRHSRQVEQRWQKSGQNRRKNAPLLLYTRDEMAMKRAKMNEIDFFEFEIDQFKRKLEFLTSKSIDIVDYRLEMNDDLFQQLFDRYGMVNRKDQKSDVIDDDEMNHQEIKYEDYIGGIENDLKEKYFQFCLKFPNFAKTSKAYASLWSLQYPKLKKLCGEINAANGSGDDGGARQRKVQESLRRLCKKYINEYSSFLKKIRKEKMIKREKYLTCDGDEKTRLKQGE